MPGKPNSTAQVLDAQPRADQLAAHRQARQLVLTSVERSALDVDEYARLAVAFAESGEQKARRAATEERVNILRDEWAPLVREKLRSYLTPDLYSQVVGEGGDYLDQRRNPMRQICEELAVLYTSPPKRETRESDDGQRYMELLRETGFDQFWQVVELLLEACNEVVIWPDVIERAGRKSIKHRYATGNDLTVVVAEDDPTEIECVIVHQAFRDLSGVDHRRYVLWTEDWHGTYEAGEDGLLQRIGVTLLDEDNVFDDAPNPYGELPFVFIRRSPWQDTPFDVTTGKDMVDLVIYGGCDRQLFNRNRKFSGFKSLVGTGSPDNITQQVLDPGVIRFVEGDVTVTQVDWQLDLKAYQDSIDSDDDQVAASRGISPSRYRGTGSHNTNVSARMSERGLLERRARMAPVFAAAERAYYRKSAVVWAAHGVPSTHKGDGDFLVVHAPLTMPTDPLQQMQVDQFRLSTGLTSAVELYRRDHPEATPDEARNAIQQNMEDTAWVQRQKVTHNIPNNPLTESASAEQNGAMGTPAREAARNETSPSPPGSAPGDQTPTGERIDD